MTSPAQSPSRPTDQRAPAASRALRTILGVYLVTAAAVALQRTLLSRENNFWIFRAAFDHLRTGADLYAAYPELHTDFFKYSPTFALLFADVLGDRAGRATASPKRGLALSIWPWGRRTSFSM